MNRIQSMEKPARAKYLSVLYVFTLFTMALTGFGQMPIYKRYYLADIPGMTWLADFYITRYIHYIGAMVLLALIAYAVLNYLLLNRNNRRLTGYGYASIFLMAGIIITGIFFTVKNLPGFFFSPGFVHVINLGHMGFAVLFLAISIYVLVFRKKWAASR